MKSSNWKSVKIALFAICAFTIFDTGNCLAENSADKLRAYPATNWSGQSLYCEASYGIAACKAETRVLLSHLRAYPVAQLGSWTWVLVPSSEWRSISLRVGLDPASPAFTSLTDRITFLEETLVAPDARRGGDLIRTFGMSMQDLLELAISHELGHGLCGFIDEHKADLAGERLRTGDYPYCEQHTNRNVKVAFGLRPDVLGGN
jgi:hypothetical protein